MIRRVIAVGDAHVEPGQDISRFAALGRYANHVGATDVVLIGDFISVDSLNSYEKPGAMHMEGVRLTADITAGANALAMLTDQQYTLDGAKGDGWKLHYCEGNHEERINRWWADNAVFEGLGSISAAYARYVDTFTPYRRGLDINGVMFTHVPFNRAKPVGGVSPARRASMVVDRSVVFGHTHRLDIDTWGNFGSDRTNFAINIGCFFPEENDPNYADGRLKDFWRGIFDITIEDDGQLEFSIITLDNLVREFIDE